MPLELVKGREYRIRLTDGSWVTGEYLYTKESQVHGNLYKWRQNRHFIFRNCRTDRTIEIKSMQRIKERVVYQEDGRPLMKLGTEVD